MTSQLFTTVWCYRHLEKEGLIEGRQVTPCWVSSTCFSPFVSVTGKYEVCLPPCLGKANHWNFGELERWGLEVSDEKESDESVIVWFLLVNWEKQNLSLILIDYLPYRIQCSFHFYFCFSSTKGVSFVVVGCLQLLFLEMMYFSNRPDSHGSF